MPQPTADMIRRRRTMAGLTQAEAGALLYTSGRRWQRWEAGDAAMEAALWELFCLKTLGVSSDKNHQ